MSKKEKYIYMETDEENVNLRNGGKSAEKIKQEISGLLTQAIIEQVPILHISHTDLDGYGCSKVMSVMPQYIRPSAVSEYYDSGECETFNERNINITCVNTSKLNDSLFDALYPIAYGFVNGIGSAERAQQGWSAVYQEEMVDIDEEDYEEEEEETCDDNMRCPKPILLITDISGFDIERLVHQYSEQFLIIVIDHHQWTQEMATDKFYEQNNNPELTDSEVTYRSWDVSGCHDGRVEIAATIEHCDPDFIEDAENIEDLDAYLYICSDHSATKLLMDIMTINVKEAILDLRARVDESKDDILQERLDRAERSFPIMQQVAEVVSLYDTGHFGTWYVPKDEEKHPKVSFQTAVNEMFRWYDPTDDVDLWHSRYDRLNYVFQWAYYVIRFQPEGNNLPVADIDITHSIMDKDRAGADDWRWSQSDSVIREFVELSRKYDDEWMPTLVPFRVGALEEGYVGLTMEHTECEKSYTDKIKKYVAEMNNLALGRYMIRIASEDEDYPMSIYAQKMLKDSPEVDYFMEIKEKADKVIVSLRSVKEEANCVEIANANHGGGHIHAAGFTLK